MKAHSRKTGVPIDSEHADVPIEGLRESLTPAMVKAA